MSIHALAYTHIHNVCFPRMIYTHIHKYSHIHKYTHTSTQSYMHTATCTHTCMHPYIHIFPHGLRFSWWYVRKHHACPCFEVCFVLVPMFKSARPYRAMLEFFFTKHTVTVIRRQFQQKRSVRDILHFLTGNPCLTVSMTNHVKHARHREPWFDCIHDQL